MARRNRIQLNTNPAQLARRERCTERQINLTLSLAFLAPQLIKAAVEGRLPRGINIERLRDPDPNWAKQFRDLGLNPSDPGPPHKRQRGTDQHRQHRSGLRI
jgi:hypothetical protein